MTKLTDLPLPILGRIAALISKGNRSKYAVFPFQVDAGYRSFHLLAPLRLTCKALLAACDFAVKGLSVDSFSVPLFASSKLSFPVPCLALIIDCCFDHPQSFAPVVDYLERVSTLRLLSIAFANTSLPFKVSQLPSFRSLCELHLERCDEITVSHFLSFPYECLATLRLYNASKIPEVPQRGLRTLKTLDVLFCNDGGYGDADCDFDRLLEFSCTPLLQNLYLHKFKVSMDLFRMSFEGRRRFELLESLSLDSPGRKERGLKFVEFAARRGCFPKLRELEVIGKSNPYNELESIAHSCRASLKTLKIEVNNFSVKTDLDALLGIRIAESVEVELTIGYFPLDAPCRVELLERLHCLVSIKECGKHVFSIDMLAAFPKLRAASFNSCKIRTDEKDKLLKDPGHLTQITFYDCMLTNEHGVEKPHNAYEPYSFEWERLSE